MEWLIWVGAGVAVLGVAGIIWSLLLVARARREALDDAALRERIARAMPVNLGALLLSMLGLGIVIVGMILA